MVEGQGRLVPLGDLGFVELLDPEDLEEHCRLGDSAAGGWPMGSAVQRWRRSLGGRQCREVFD
jgi:hypothetical protein